MNLNDKIVKIIEGLNLSNTKFADNIDVSRPTISHIISGRNKPSIDVIQKIMVKYPELGYKWFLDDELLDDQKLTQLINNEQDKGVIDDTIPVSESRRNNNPGVGSGKLDTNSPRSKEVTSVVSSESAVRKVEKVIMFYSDGTMEVLSGAVAV